MDNTRCHLIEKDQRYDGKAVGPSTSSTGALSTYGHHHFVFERAHFCDILVASPLLPI